MSFKPNDEPIPGYKLVQFLGAGQFGQVWKATSPGQGEVALKFLDLSEKPGRKEFRSIQAIKTIRHPHLAGISALWMLDQHGNLLDDVDVISSIAPGRDEPTESSKPETLVVAQTLGDESLMDRLKRCESQTPPGIPTDELLGYMEEAAKGIDYLNARRHDLGNGLVGVQHCDIKPANILLLGGSVLICDYGVARVLKDKTLDMTATKTGFSGSLAYASPEFLTNGRPSQSSDQYSLAITYVQLRTGNLPFESEEVAAVIDAHRQGRLKLDGLSPAECKVIRKATSPNPKRRFADCTAMVVALRLADSSPSKPTLSDSVASLSLAAFQSSPLRRIVPLAGATIVLLLLISFGSAVLNPPVHQTLRPTIPDQVFDTEGFDAEGFDAEGFNALGFDREGFGRDGLNALGFDKDGFGRDGFNRHGIDRHGFDRKGFGLDGYSALGFDNEGFGRDGFNKENVDRNGFDREGFGPDGFNALGFDNEGFGRDGFNKENVDRDGFDRNGFGPDGFNALGFDNEGFGRDGYDQDGYDRERVHKEMRLATTWLAQFNKALGQPNDTRHQYLERLTQEIRQEASTLTQDQARDAVRLLANMIASVPVAEALKADRNPTTKKNAIDIGTQVQQQYEKIGAWPTSTFRDTCLASVERLFDFQKSLFGNDND